jgi:hypothetical protein
MEAAIDIYAMDVDATFSPDADIFVRTFHGGSLALGGDLGW